MKVYRKKGRITAVQIPPHYKITITHTEQDPAGGDKWVDEQGGPLDYLVALPGRLEIRKRTDFEGEYEPVGEDR